MYFHALGHDVRQRLFRLMANRTKPVSPAEASRKLAEEISNVVYHMHALEEAGLVELVDERRIRGAMEHFYSPVKTAISHPIIKGFLDLR